MKKLPFVMIVGILLINSCTSTVQMATVTPVSPSKTLMPTQTIEPTSTSTPIPVPPLPQRTGTTAPSLPTEPFENHVYQEGNSYVFEFVEKNMTLQYLYCPLTGSLNDLRAKIDKGSSFLPSNYGGPSFVVSGTEIPIWEADSKLQLSHVAPILKDNSLEITWNARSGDQTISYTYHFSVSGSTLQIQVDSTSSNISQFTLDRSEETPGARILFIPYLSTFNILLYQKHFISAYFDWIETHASGIEGMNAAYSKQSYYFGQTAQYKTDTKNARSPLHEVVYLTVSDKLSDVLPNIPNPRSTYRAVLAGRVVLDMWTEDSFSLDRDLLVALQKKGIKDLLVIKHTWQNCGYDNCYPTVIPANPGWGGDAGLSELSKAAREAGYLFALHENYVDFYPNSSMWDPKVVALNPDGTQIKAWYNESTGIQSYLLSPAHIFDFATQLSPEIHSRYGTTASFLDVHTAVDPSGKVDYNAEIGNGDRMSTTFDAYSQLVAYERLVHEGPVLGEGNSHFLYAGIVDGVEAQYQGFTLAGPSIPPIVDFDLIKIHPLMVNHGMGYYERYFEENGQPKWSGYSQEDYYHYMSTEIAFCHAGFVPTPDRVGGAANWIARVEQETSLVLPIQKLCALAAPKQILYHADGNLVGVEEALIKNQAWQVFVEYDSGLQVYVNRHPSENWVITPSSSQSWVDYSALIDGERKDYVGTQSLPSYIIPPNGWLAFLP